MRDADDAGIIRLLERTPPDAPAFTRDLHAVLRRGRTLRVRRRSGFALLGLFLAVAVATPLLLLTGLVRLPRTPSLGMGGHPMKLIEYYEPSEAMDPTIRVGDVVQVDTNAYLFGRTPELGDIVLFRHRSQGQTFQLLKRVIGLPGQTIEIQRGVVSIDGQKLVELYLNSEQDLHDYGPYVVEPGHLFVLGDNRFNSNDSRFSSIGQVALTDVIGKVVGFADSGSDATSPIAPAAKLGSPSATPSTISSSDGQRNPVLRSATTSVAAPTGVASTGVHRG
jgi:signal peptidase I